MEITLNIKAPEISAAILALASSVACLGEVLEGRIPSRDATYQDPSQMANAPYAPENQYQAPAPVQQQLPQQPAYQAPAPQTPYQAPQQPVYQAPAPVQPPANGVPVAPLTYTMESLAVAATQLMDAGRQDIIQNLLASFGIPALTALPKGQYGNFASHLRANGAQI